MSFLPRFLHYGSQIVSRPAGDSFSTCREKSHSLRLAERQMGTPWDSRMLENLKLEGSE